MSDKTKASEEQIAYANVLNIGMWLGLALLIITFFVYLSGVLPSYVPIDDLPKYWSMRVHDFNVALNAPTGWGWTALVGKGDYLNFVGIAILSGLTILCYIVILPIRVVLTAVRATVDAAGNKTAAALLTLAFSINSSINQFTCCSPFPESPVF